MPFLLWFWFIFVKSAYLNAMKIDKAAVIILNQLADVVTQIQQADFVKPSETLSHSTIGQHVRHTLEFFSCFDKGIEEGTINYDMRAHDTVIETDKAAALSTIDHAVSFVKTVSENIPLKLQVGYSPMRDEFETIDTNSTRELAYNIEHAVHHMALIKIAVKDVAPYVRLDINFGIAASTVRHQKVAGSLSSIH